MSRGWWYLVGALTAAALAAGAVALVRRQAARTPSPAAAQAHEAAAPAATVVSLPARVQARQVVPVEAEVAGDVAEFLADVGQEVYQGQLLARISNRTLASAGEEADLAARGAQDRVAKLEAALLAARLEASRARADAQRSRDAFEQSDRLYKRQKMLYAEGATPRLVYEKSEKEALGSRKEYDSLDLLAGQAEARVQAILTQIEAARQFLADRARELENARANLKAGEVYAPVDGLVVARRGEVGKPLEGENRELFQIAVNAADLEALVEAEPSALERLRPGDEAMLFFADVPGEGIPGTVARIEGGQARIEFLSPDPLIKPGITAQVRITLR